MSKRITIPHYKTAPSKPSQVINSTDALLNDAKLIIAAELARYRSKTTKGISLDLKEARVVQGYLDSLTRLQKEEREQARANDLSAMSNEELLELAEAVFGQAKPSIAKAPNPGEVKKTDSADSVSIDSKE